MTSETQEIRFLLRALTRKLDRTAQDYTGHHIAMACYGLQNMAIEEGKKEVEYLLMVLADRIESSQHQLTAQSISTAVYGLKVSLTIYRLTVWCYLFVTFTAWVTYSLRSYS